uniref:Uncharacterized protein n=1 Tax=Arundo donax TaxID=35708 RepID=A0A0A9HTL9_ARUDO
MDRNGGGDGGHSESSVDAMDPFSRRHGSPPLRRPSPYLQHPAPRHLLQRCELSDLHDEEGELVAVVVDGAVEGEEGLDDAGDVGIVRDDVGDGNAICDGVEDLDALAGAIDEDEAA